jgi:hypothetical protein
VGNDNLLLHKQYPAYISGVVQEIFETIAKVSLEALYTRP